MANNRTAAQIALDKFRQDEPRKQTYSFEPINIEGDYSSPKIGEKSSPDTVDPAVAAAKSAQQSSQASAEPMSQTADTSAADTGAMAAGAAGGPAGMAAMIGLKLYSAAKKAEFADKQAKYKAHLDQRNAMSNALDSMIQTTRSLRL